MNSRIVLVTGAKGGLGSFVTQVFLASGATVVGASRSIKHSDFPSPNFSAFEADVSSRDAARQFVGTMAHPLNRPRYDAVRRRVVEGRLISTIEHTSKRSPGRPRG